MPDYAVNLSDGPFLGYSSVGEGCRWRYSLVMGKSYFFVLFMPCFTLRTMKAQNIFLVGLMAVGKSTVGRQLADALSRPFFDADQEIERRAGAEISWIFDVEGETGFREREASVIDELTQKEGIVLATGGGAILREDNRRHLAARGLVFHLDSPIDKLVARTRRDSKRPLLQGGDPARTLRDLKAARGPLYAAVADHRVMTDHRGAGAVTRKILRLLEQKNNELTRSNT